MKKSMLILCLLSFISGSIEARRYYPDSIQALSAQEPRIEKGWNFEFYGGAGLGRFEFQQLGAQYTPAHTDTRLAYPTWNAGLSINYYFLPWMGIGTGAEFHNYVNTVDITRGWSVTRQDYQNDTYTLTATPSNLREQESLSMLEVPIALRFRAIPKRVGFIGSLGVKLGFPMINNYRLDPNGKIANVVDYPYWNWTWSNVPGVMEDVQLAQKKGSNAFKTINYAAFIEAGLLIQLSQRIDLAISAFGNFYFNDVLSEHTADLSFAAEYAPSAYIEPPFTGNYAGVLATNEVQQLHPWSAGLKIGLHINANRTKAQREYDEWAKTAPWEYEFEDDEDLYNDTTGNALPADSTTLEQPVEATTDTTAQQVVYITADCHCPECDTTPQIIIIHDTIIQYVQQLDELLSTSVIFFNLDDVKPILEPEDILINIANTLKAHPTMRVLINGHACKLGSPGYNMILAKKRAETVANRLRALGVRDDQMTVRSLGSKHPFRYNGLHTLSKDRRVEIIPEGIGYPSETTEKVIPGSRLAQIARRHYGEPEYWVFIYEANRKKISKPDDIQIGTELVIPDLSRRLNGMSKEQVQAEVERLKAKIKTKKR
ncbi:MAG: OmpA family protein [Paludibacteraceae bacterium]|nr:OmpA family protein [Paludibacteraceae bacterium]